MEDVLHVLGVKETSRGGKVKRDRYVVDESGMQAVCEDFNVNLRKTNVPKDIIARCLEAANWKKELASINASRTMSKLKVFDASQVLTELKKLKPDIKKFEAGKVDVLTEEQQKSKIAYRTYARDFKKILHKEADKKVTLKKQARTEIVEMNDLQMDFYNKKRAEGNHRSSNRVHPHKAKKTQQKIEKRVEALERTAKRLEAKAHVQDKKMRSVKREGAKQIIHSESSSCDERVTSLTHEIWTESDTLEHYSEEELKEREYDRVYERFHNYPQPDDEISQEEKRAKYENWRRNRQYNANATHDTFSNYPDALPKMFGGFDEFMEFLDIPISVINAIRAHIMGRAYDLLKKELPEIVDFWGCVLAFAYQFSRATCTKDVVAAVYCWGRANGLNTRIIAHYMREIAAIVGPAFTGFKECFITTEASLAEMGSEFMGMLNMIFSSSVVSALRDFIVAVLSFKLFDKDVSKKFFAVLGKPIGGPMINVMSSILTDIIKIVRFGEAILSGVPVSEALFAEDPVHAVLAQVDTLKYQIDHIYVGLPVEGRHSAIDILTRLKDAKESLEYLIPKSPPHKEATRNMRKALEWVKEGTERMKRRIESSSRPTPFAMIICGPPEIGKSKILLVNYQLWCEAKGIEYIHGMVYTRVISQAFWDGYIPGSQEIAHYPELGCMSKEQAAKAQDLTITELVSVLDSSALSLPMADVKDKGQTFCMIGALFADSNNPGMNLEQLVSCPLAYLRRFKFCEPTVRPECRQIHGPGIDKEKVKSSGFSLLDIWTFSIYVHVPDPNNPNKPKKHYLAKDLDIYHYRAFTLKLMKDHIEHEQNMLQRMEAVDMKSYNKYEYIDGEYRMIEVKEEIPEIACEADVVERESWYPIWYVKTLPKLYLEQMKCTGIVAVLRSLKVTNKQKFFCCDWQRIILFFLLFYIMVWKISLIFFFFPLVVFLHPMAFVGKVGNAVLEFYVSQFETQKALCMSNLQYIRNNGKIDLSSAWYKKYQLTIGAVLVSLTVLATTYKFFWQKPIERRSEAHSNFLHETVENAPLNKVEDELSCGISYTRIPVKGTQLWNTAVDSTPCAYTGSPEGLLHKVYKNSKYVRVFDGVNPNWKQPLRTHILGVYGNRALINTHALGVNPKKMFIQVCEEYRYSDDELVIKSEFYSIPEQRSEIGNDMTLIETPYTFGNILCHFPETTNDNYFPPGSEAIIGNFHTKVMHSGPITMKDPKIGKINLKDSLVYEWALHKSGYCGMPIIVKKGKGSCIGGLHSGSGEFSHATLVLRLDIEKASKKIAQSSPYLPIHSEGSLNIQCFPPLHKSLVHYEHLPSIAYYGRDGNKCLPNQISSVKKSLIHDRVDDMIHRHFGVTLKKQFGPPPLKAFWREGEYYGPYNIGVRAMANVKAPLHPDIMSLTIDMICNHIFSELDDKSLNLSPLTIEAAVNGVQHDPFLRRMASNTSAGYGWVGKKNKHIPLVELDPYVRECTPQLKSRILECIEIYRKGETCRFVFATKLKDEPRAMEKNLVGKTRLFYMSPIEQVILCRMFLYPIYTLMDEFHDAFCAAIGMSAHVDVDKFMKEMLEFANQWMDWDYKNYDVSMPFDIGQAVNAIIVNICRRYGYSEEAIYVVMGILSDEIFPMIEILTDIFMVAGLQCSGKYGTANNNSLRNLVLMVYAWCISPILRKMNFFSYVKPRTYGDDVLSVIKESVLPYYNMLYFKKVCETHFRMTITSASKDKELIAVTTLSEVSFIKRTFVYCEKRQSWKMPLDIESIGRSMKWILPSNAITEEQQLVETCASAIMELFFHDEDKSKLFRIEMIDVLSQFMDIQEVRRKIPDLGQLARSVYGDRWDETPRPSLPIIVDTESSDEPQTSLVHACNGSGGLFSPPMGGSQYNYSLFPYAASQLGLCRPSCAISRHSKIENAIYQLELEMKAIEEPLSGDPLLDGLSLDELRDSPHLRYIPAFRKTYDMRTKYLSKIADIELTIGRMKRALYKRKQIITESDVNIMHEGAPQSPEEDWHQNVLDIGGNEVFSTYGGDDGGIPENGQMHMLSIDDFFARPVKLAEGTFPLATPVVVAIPVWDQYTLNPTVRAKLRNYAYLKGTLHLKVSFAGTPYHYGRAGLSYQPFGTDNKALASMVANYTIDSSFITLLNNYLSQAPGFTSMNVGDNQPVEIVCPYLGMKPAFRLYNSASTAISAGTSYEDLVDAGDLFLTTLNPVGCITATPSTISYVVYAWMTDVSLGTGTATQVEITTESDERKVGPVEKLTSASAKITQLFIKTPVIGVYALASTIALKGLSAASAVLGWSKPIPDIRPQIVKNMGYMNGAHTIGYDTNSKITLDPHQELTVDNRIMGDGTDEMTINHIASVPSLLGFFLWSPADVPGVSLLEQTVSPYAASSLVRGGKTYHQPSAVCFAAQPFFWWRGDMKYKLQIVCSAYHRGKFAVYYEPNLHQKDLILAGLGFNKQYIMLIDIQETQEIEFSVNWASPREWLIRTTDPSWDELSSLNGGTMTTSAVRGVNGFFVVTPYTTLQSPDNSSVAINLYAWCDNLQVTVPYDGGMPSYRHIVTESDNATKLYDLNDSSADDSNIATHHFGERCVSFRSLLKRYLTVGTTSLAIDATTKKVAYQTHTIYPAISPAYGSTAVTYKTIYSYLRYAYVGLRGSMRYRYFLHGETGAISTQGVKVSLENPTNATSTASSITGGSLDALMMGSVNFLPASNAGMEVELPCYTANLFLMSFSDNLMPSDDEGVENRFTRNVKVNVSLCQANANTITLSRDVATGEDFQFFRFQGAPYFSDS